MGPARSDRRDALCRTRCAANMACPASSWRRPGSTATTPRACSSSRRSFRSCAASVTSRARTRRRPTARRAARPMRSGAPASRGSRRSACASTCRRRGGILREAARLAADYPGTQIILNHTGPARRSLARGRRGWRAAMATLARQPNVAVKISGIGQRGAAMDSGRESRHRAHRDRPLRRRALHVREQLPGRQPVRDASRRSSTAFARSWRTCRIDEQRALFRDNAMRIYAIA